eukprot:6600720-Prymnesium_polylepis.1
MAVVRCGAKARATRDTVPDWGACGTVPADLSATRERDTRERDGEGEGSWEAGIRHYRIVDSHLSNS